MKSTHQRDQAAMFTKWAGEAQSPAMREACLALARNWKDDAPVTPSNPTAVKISAETAV